MGGTAAASSGVATVWLQAAFSIRQRGHSDSDESESSSAPQFGHFRGEGSLMFRRWWFHSFLKEPGGEGYRRGPCLIMLNLDPVTARAGLPQPIMGPTTLGMEFYASAPGIAYTAKTSEDMETWVTDGVTLSELDPDGRRMATADRSSPRRFMRLVVAEE